MEYLMLLCLNFYANTADCHNYPVYCQIKKNNPNLDIEYAFRVSRVIRKMEKKYEVPPKIMAAILMQESSYRLNAVGNHGRSKDYGISQINHKTANLYGFEINRLLNDLEYSIESGAVVLHWFMKNFKHKEKDWYTRYNCGSGGSTKRETCQNYKKKVEKYL